MTVWLAILTILLPWAGAICVWWIGDRHPSAQHISATIFSVLAGLTALALLPFTSDKVVLSIPLGTVFGDFTLVLDGLGVFLAVVAAVVGSLAVLFSNDYMHGEAQLGRYYALVLLFIGAMIGLSLSGSLLLMFIFWEITAFCSYALISFYNDDPKAVAGGIKALIMTQLGGVGLLAGALVAYSYLGSYQIQAFLAGAETLPANVLSLIAFGFLIAAAAKSAQVPLHTWLPDAMEAPTPVSALIHAATMVNAGVYLLARFYPAFEAVPGWTISVITVGMLSAFLAAIMALVCNDLKRTLAYSTISQLGYMVFAIGCGGIYASQFHLMSHAVFKALLFLGAGAVIHATGTRDMRQMGGLGAQMPFVRGVFIIGSLALAGLPIANGFFSKELVLESGLADGPLWAYLFMLLGAGITALYTMRMVWMVFYGKPARAIHVHDAPRAMRISLGVLAFGTLTTWLLAGPFSRFLADSLPYHNLHTESTVALIQEIVTAPATWIALVVIAVGLAAWFNRARLTGLAHSLQPLASFAGRGMGFDGLNEQIVALTRKSASAMGVSQTGLLSWNVVGIIGGLIITLILLAWVG
jgi:NADH-quinone oxidoreductase subunit L